MVQFGDIIIAVLLVPSALATLLSLHSSHLDEQWREFIQRHNKVYTSLTAYVKRLRWEDNLRKIHRHNEEAEDGLHNYTLKMNHLTDISAGEYVNNYLGLHPSGTRKIIEPSLDIYGGLNSGVSILRGLDRLTPHRLDWPIPEELDWRKLGLKMPSWDQKSCGACYAFAVVASLQSQVTITTGKHVDLSEQQVVDCSLITGNLGCDGGSLKNTLQYVQTFGLMDNEDYPYTGRTGICRYQADKAHYKILSWAILPSQNEEALKTALAMYGPLPVSLDATPPSFQFYHNGIYHDPNCATNKVNHAMLLVGYTKDAWILKNWWTSKWGTDGYMYLKRNVNQCGVANFAAYITQIQILRP